jgi:hypothetical protein
METKLEASVLPGNTLVQTVQKTGYASEKYDYDMGWVYVDWIDDANAAKVQPLDTSLAEPFNDGEADAEEYANS